LALEGVYANFDRYQEIKSPHRIHLKPTVVFDNRTVFDLENVSRDRRVNFHLLVVDVLDGSFGNQNTALAALATSEVHAEWNTFGSLRLDVGRKLLDDSFPDMCRGFTGP